MDGFYGDFRSDMAAFEQTIFEFLHERASQGDVQVLAALCERTYAHWGDPDRLAKLRRKDPEMCQSLISSLQEHCASPARISQVRELLLG
jgi:hypothetical protein